MRICLLNPWFEPYPGGIERRLLNMARGLAARGHEVHVVCALIDGTVAVERVDGFRIVRLPSRFFGRYRPQFVYTGVEALVREIRSIDPHIVDLHFRWSPDYTLAALKLARTYPVTLTYHNGHGEGAGVLKLLSELNDRMIDRAIHRFAQVVAVSEHLSRDLQRRGLRVPMTTIYNGVTLPASMPPPGSQDYLLAVCRLVPTKGLRDLVQAMAICRDRHGITDMRVRFVGMGPEEKPVTELARRLDLADRVTFMGYVKDEEKDALMAGCRVYCMPSHNESFGMAAIEAMVFGRPVVACSVEGLPEAVGPGGILVPPRDPETLAGALAELWRDDVKRRAYGEAALRHARQFTWDRCVVETERLYAALSGESAEIGAEKEAAAG